MSDHDVRELRRKFRHLFDGEQSTDIAIIDDIKALCYDVVDASYSVDAAPSAALFFSVVLDETNGLIAYLDGIMKKSQGKDGPATVGGVEIIGIVVEHIDGKLLKEKLNLLTSLLLRTFFLYHTLKKTAEMAAVVTGKLFLALDARKRDSGLNISTEEARVGDFILTVQRLLDVGGRRTNDQKRTLFILGGHLARFYPLEFAPLVEKYHRTLATELTLQTTSDIHSTTYSVSEACIAALDGILYNYSHVINNQKIYEAARSVVSAAAAGSRQTGGFSRFGPTRAALRLFISHARLFSSDMYREYRKLNNDFAHWASKEEAELRKLGLNAVDALLKEVTFQLEETEIARNPATAKIVYSYFTNQLKNSLLFSESARELSQAAKNISYFTKACSKLEGWDKKVELLISITDRGESLFLSPDDSIDNKMLYLPLLLEALSRLISGFGACQPEPDETSGSRRIPERCWTAIENLQVLYFHHFPLIDYRYHFRTRLLTCHLVLAALPHQPTFLDRIVRQSLLKIFSTPPTDSTSTNGNQEMPGTPELSHISVTDYLPLWKLLVNVDDVKEHDFFGYMKADIRLVGKVFVAATFKSVMSFIGNLDFTSIDSPTLADTTQEATSPMKHCDLVVFQNLVHFVKELLKHIPVCDFVDLVTPISQALMEQSVRHYHIGGFYTLIASVLKVANTCDYFIFDEVSAAESGRYSERRRLRLSLAVYTDQIVERLCSFKSDIFVSAVSFLVSLPISIVATKVCQLGKALQMGFGVGSTYLPLAEACLEAFESWVNALPTTSIEKLCRVVLPTFDVYLSTEHSEQDERSQHRIRSVAEKKLKAKRTQFRRNPERGAEGGDEDGDRLKKIRSRMALILGRLGGELNISILTDDSVQLARECVKWDCKACLQFEIPFPDVKLILTLDDFIPIICELAVNSGNRKSKTAACELLHSVVVFAIGYQATSLSANKYNINGLLKRLLPYLLRLCCDTDTIPQQLFQPLIIQLVHRFVDVTTSGSAATEAPETATLLDGLMDGLLVDSAAVRECAASCLNEYLAWSLRRKKQESRFRARSLLKRLYRFARHPAVERRLGAATVFNAIYKTFREDDNLVDEYIFEVFAECMASLATACRDPDSSGSVELWADVIDHLTRIILGASTNEPSVYLDKLKELRRNRRLPDECGWDTATVDGLRRWLWTKIGSPDAAYRQKCWDLLAHSVWRTIEGCTLTDHWTNLLNADNGVDVALQLFERFDLSAVPTELLENQHHLQQWLNGFYAAVDCYYMGFAKALPKINELLSSGKSHLAEATNFFIKSVVRQLLKENTNGQQMPSAMKRVCCSVLVRLFHIAHFRFKVVATSTTAFDQCLLSFDFIELLVDCCVDAGLLGFDVTDIDLLSSLRTTVTRTLSSLKKSTGFTSAINSHIGYYLQRWHPFPSVKQLLESDIENDSDSLAVNCTRVYGYVVLEEAGVNTAVLLQADGLWATVVQSLFHFSAGPRGTRRLRELSSHQMSLVKAVAELVLRQPAVCRQVINHLLDDAPVLVVGSDFSRATATVGRVVVETLVTPLARYLSRYPVEVVAEMLRISSTVKGRKAAVICNCLLTLIEEVIADSTLRKTYGKGIQMAVVSNWDTAIAPLVEHRDNNVKLSSVKLLLKLALIETDNVLNSLVPKVPDAFRSNSFAVFLRLLKDKSLKHSEKNEVLKLLAVIVDDCDTTVLRAALTAFVAELPRSSAVVAEGGTTALRSDCLTTFRRLLFALSCTDATIILDAVTLILCRDSHHFADHDIGQWLQRYAMRMPAQKVENLLAVPYRRFLGFLADGNAANDSNAQRRSVLEKILIPLLLGVGEGQRGVFFTMHITEIMAKIDQDVAMESPMSIKQDLLTTKLGCFLLLEIMYNMLPMETTKGSISAKYGQSKPNVPNALTKDVVRLSSSAREKGKLLDDTVGLDMACAAHCCLSAVISATQTEKFISFADKMLFPNTVWELIVDRNVSYQFELELQQLPTRRRQLVALAAASGSNAVRTADNQTTVEANALSQNVSSLDFLSSQVLAESSFGGSVSASSFDFTDASAASRTVSTTLIDNRKRSEMWSNQVTLESDSLNMHLSMQSLMALVNQMTQKTKPEHAKLQWVKCTVDGLKNGQLNEKLLIARLLLNCETAIRPFAAHFVDAVAKFVASPEFTKDGIHYFAVDLLVMIAGWASDSVFPKDELACGILRMLVERSNFSSTGNISSQLLNRNVRLVQVLCKLWQPRVSLDSDFLLRNLMKTGGVTVTEKDIIASLQLTAALLQSRVCPFNLRETDQSTADRFYESIISMLGHPSVNVYRPASEVVGLALVFLIAKGESVDLKSQKLGKVVNELVSKGRTDSQGKFLKITYGIQQHYRAFATTYDKELLSLFARLHGDMKTLCLEILFSLVGSIANILKELKARDLEKLLGSGSEPDHQLWSLKIVKNVVEKKADDPSELLSLLPVLSQFIHHSDILFRTVAVELSILLFDEHVGSTNGRDGGVSGKLLEFARQALLSCVDDSDPALRQKVCNFWSHERRLPQDVVGRSTALLRQMFNPTSDTNFLSYSTYLLLERSAQSSDFDRQLFPQPLSECAFESVNVTTNWRHRFSAVETPSVGGASQPFVYAHTISTLASDADTTIVQPGMVLATQAVPQKFDATQAGGVGSQHYDWLSGNTYEERFSENTLSSMITASNETADAFSRPSNQKRRKAVIGSTSGITTATAKEKDQYAKEKDSQATEVELRRLKRRVLKNRHQTSQIMARLTAKRKLAHERAAKMHKEAREHKVQLYRSYRIGELPDIQIPHSALISPLQALAQHDESVAAMLFEQLIGAVLNHVRTTEGENQLNDTGKDISLSIDTILKASSVSGSVVRSVLTLAYRFPSVIKLEASVVAHAAVATMQQHAGIVLLERYLLLEDTAQPPPTKRPRTSNSDSDMILAALLRLYKSIGDSDQIEGIIAGSGGDVFLKATRGGLQLEANGDFTEASKKYTEALKHLGRLPENQWNAAHSAEQELLEEFRMKCLTELGEWDKVKIIVERQIDEEDIENIWLNDEQLDQCFAPFVRSNLKLFVDQKQDDAELKRLIRWSQDEQKRDVIEMKVPSEAAMSCLILERYEEAKRFSRIVVDHFLKDWSGSLKSFRNIRRNILSSLQLPSELLAFIDIHRRSSHDASDDEMLQFCRSVCRRYPHSQNNSCSEWEQVVSNRIWLFEKAVSSSGMNSTGFYDQVIPMEFEARLRFAEAAVLHNNFPVALKQLTVAEARLHLQLSDAVEDPNAPSSLLAKKISCHLSWSETQVERGEKIRTILAGLHDNSALLTGNFESDCAVGVSLFRLGKLCWEAPNRWFRSGNVDADNMRLLSSLADLNNQPELQPSMLAQQLFNKADTFLTSSVKTYASNEIELCPAGQRQHPLIAYCDYCDELLRLLEDTELTPSRKHSVDKSDVAAKLTSSLLTALCLGISDGQTRFPRLLSLLQLYGDRTRTAFQQGLEGIPVWMFLDWVNQIVAILDTEYGLPVQPIVLQLVNQYPQAVYYAFKLSAETFSFNGATQQQKIFYESIDATLGQQSQCTELITALRYLADPGSLFKIALNDVRLLFRRSASVTEYTARIKQLCAELFFVNPDTGRQELPKDAGFMWQKISNKYTKFKEQFGPFGRKLTDAAFDRKKVDALKQFQKEIESLPPSSLKEYCAWFNNFEPSAELPLELPGQYRGGTKPEPEYHVRIASFDDRTTVMKSLQRPKVLTVIGDDGKDHRYLIKHNEDLRQDQRIEQVLEQMNDLFDADVECKRRALRIRTYHVEPLTSSLGMIQFMDNVCGLGDFMLPEMNKAEVASKNVGKIWEKHFYDKCLIRTTEATKVKYAASIGRYPPKTVGECMASVRGEICDDVLRRSLQRICRDPQSFVTVRNLFATSHATLCAAHYILGIGDRHLQNVMVDASSGQSVGIDFGHAFGSGVQVLPIPELVPFRLTQQITAAMNPIGVGGEFRGAMRCALTAIRRQRHLLGNTLDVFLREPSVDWLLQAKKQDTGQTRTQPVYSDDVADSLPEDEQMKYQWYPKQKLSTVIRKLNGDNPVLVMREELAQSPNWSSSQRLMGYLSTLLCGQDHNEWDAGSEEPLKMPRGFPPANLTIDEQIDCLIDMATDARLLGRVWMGWEPWW